MFRNLSSVLLITVLLFSPFSAAQAQSPEGDMGVFAQMIEKLTSVITTLEEKLAAGGKSTMQASVATAGLMVGGRVQTKMGVITMSEAKSNSTLRGQQPNGSIGTVNAGPVVERIYTYPPRCNVNSSSIGCTPTITYKYWYLVNFDQGSNGWVPVTAIMPAVSAKYTVGSVFIADTDTSVRSAPGGTVISTQRDGSFGFITGSPVSSGGTVWWPTEYVTGVRGWSMESNLVNAGIPLETEEILTKITSFPVDNNQLTTWADRAAIPANSFSSLINQLRNEGVVPSAGNPIDIMRVSDEHQVYVAGGSIGTGGLNSEHVVVATSPEFNVSIYDSSEGDQMIAISDANGMTREVAAVEYVIRGEGDGHVVLTRIDDSGMMTVTVHPIEVNMDAALTVLDWPRLPNTSPEELKTWNYGVEITPNSGGEYVETGLGDFSLNDGCDCAINIDYNTPPPVAPSIDWSVRGFNDHGWFRLVPR